jgi:hypothetical protein
VVVVHPCCRERWYTEAVNAFLVAPNPTLSPVMPCNITPTTLRHFVFSGIRCHMNLPLSIEVV